MARHIISQREQLLFRSLNRHFASCNLNDWLSNVHDICHVLSPHGERAGAWDSQPAVVQKCERKSTACGAHAAKPLQKGHLPRKDNVILPCGRFSP